jgi:putative addiction module component (TIGR02574 family)
LFADRGRGDAGLERGHLVAPKHRSFAPGRLPSYNRRMPSAPPLPPPGFAQLSVSEKVEYIQALWDGLSEAEVTVPESQRDVIRARLEEHQQSPEAGRPWGEVKRDIEHRLVKQFGSK